MKKIMMIAGEPSGDLHASNLALELKRNSPGIEIIGTGGDKMRAAGVELLFDLKDLAVTGLLDVIRQIFKLKRIQSSLLSRLKDQKIDLIILVDYPDFNLRFARKAKKSGVPVIYYISPQIWAWRKGRIKIIKKYVTKMYVIFKFEEELYKKAGVDVEFVGHPLLDIIGSQSHNVSAKPPVGTTSQDKTIALLPGSRNRLVATLLPIMLKTAVQIHKKSPFVKFIISKSPSVKQGIYDKNLERYSLPVNLIENKTYDLINASDFVITISGTSTLETAILRKPMAIVYKLPIIEYIIARPLLRLKNIGLVNIVAGREIVSEFIQFRAQPQKIADYALRLLSDEPRYEAIKKDLEGVKSMLQPSGASRAAALSILKFL
ncbi:MAG: lipid-A-disaccharide synthase [Candidatus Omnitrophica bacterium]|nr:lipid-A-disaccharide synthase [Candidatus Omnitrophota bacterium]